MPRPARAETSIGDKALQAGIIQAADIGEDFGAWSNGTKGPNAEVLLLQHTHTPEGGVKEIAAPKITDQVLEYSLPILGLHSISDTDKCLISLHGFGAELPPFEGGSLFLC